MSDLNLTNFAGQNWLITPAALALGESPPKSIRDQKWLLVLSGVVVANLQGDDSGTWRHQTVSFAPDLAGADDPTSTAGPLNWAISRYSIPKPAGSVGTQYLIRFSLDEWSPFVSLGSVFDQAQSINAGFAVDVWRPHHFGSGTNVVTGQPVNNLFTGINADLAVSDSDAWLYRLSYNITLLGKIVFVAVPQVPPVPRVPNVVGLSEKEARTTPAGRRLPSLPGSGHDRQPLRRRRQCGQPVSQRGNGPEQGFNNHDPRAREAAPPLPVGSGRRETVAAGVRLSATPGMWEQFAQVRVIDSYFYRWRAIHRGGT